MRAGNKLKCQECKHKIAHTRITEPGKSTAVFLCDDCLRGGGLGGRVGWTYYTSTLGFNSLGQPLSAEYNNHR